MLFPPHFINFPCSRMKETDNQGLGFFVLPVMKNCKVLTIIQYYVDQAYRYWSYSLFQSRCLDSCT